MIKNSMLEKSIKYWEEKHTHKHTIQNASRYWFGKIFGEGIDFENHFSMNPNQNKLKFVQIGGKY